MMSCSTVPELAPLAGVAPDRATLRRLADLVTNALGICLPDGKLAMLHGRLQRRLRALGVTSLAAYELRLADPRTAGVERAELFDLATTNKTDFFREPDHFTYLMEVALPALAAGRTRWLLRLWSAGCATGQEAYTLAMLLDDHAGRHPGFDFAITATDVSMRALREAHQATYAVDLIEPVPAPLRERYLMRGRGARAGQVRVVPELRRRVRLDQQNFMDAHYRVPHDLDVVFFRNVLIYFDRRTQGEVLARQCRHLRPGGYLFIAHAESVTGLDLPLEACGPSIFRRI